MVVGIHLVHGADNRKQKNIFTKFIKEVCGSVKALWVIKFFSKGRMEEIHLWTLNSGIWNVGKGALKEASA